MDKYRKLAKQPLVFALAEFRFSPVFKIDEFIPELQEALRRAYPLPERLQEHAIEFKTGSVTISTRNRWAFVASDRRHTVTVDQDRLIYLTTDYPRFEGFAKRCLEVLEPLNRIVEPDLLLRVGLRYGDCIRIAPGAALKAYVDEYFGYPKLAAPLGVPEHQRDEVHIKTDVGRLLIRSFYGNHPLLCLPDIQAIPGVPAPDGQPSERILLDFDHYWSSPDTPVRFELPQISTLLDELHGPSREAFWRITSKHAKEKIWS